MMTQAGYFIPEQFRNHHDATNWLLEGDEFHYMLKRRSESYFALPVESRPYYVVPEKWENTTFDQVTDF